MMKLCVILALVSAAVAFEEPLRYYHETVGIAEAARIKAIEEALDFDGGRIAGGTHAYPGQFPHMGGLVITMRNGDTSICGSSLISNNRIVTAAHCWWDGRNQAREFTVVLGSIFVFSGGTRHNTNNVVMHGSWDPTTLANDIAIGVIPWTTFTNTINRINIATGSNTYAGVVATAVGFGRIGDDYGGGISTAQVLSHANMPVITNAECSRTFPIVITSTICTSGASGRSTCGGDSGGPLQASNVLIGITSFGAAAGCEKGFPAAFARVTSFASWIQSRL